jgi:hypothetical protein
MPTLLLGPELLWLLFFLSIKGLIRYTRSPRKQMDRLWISLANFVPFIAIPMTFAFYHFPGVEHSWLLLRIWVSCLLGAHYVLNTGLAAHSEQGPGVGTAYIFGMIMTIVMLAAGTVVWAVVRFW